MYIYYHDDTNATLFKFLLLIRWMVKIILTNLTMS